jgi:chemotaxis protein CheD
VTALAASSIAPDGSSSARTITVAMGRMGMARGDDHLQTMGLGSCVAIVLFAEPHHPAAMAHCMLPVRDGDDSALAKFADSAVPALCALLAAEGATAPVSAALIGGASMFPAVASDFMRDIAGANVRAARQALASAGIPVRMEDVGGHIGRSVVVVPATQRVLVRSIRGGERWL